jgi:hypothetical protein
VDAFGSRPRGVVATVHGTDGGAECRLGVEPAAILAALWSVDLAGVPKAGGKLLEEAWRDPAP